MRSEALDECDDFRQLFHPDAFDPDEGKPEAVTLAMKGIIDEPHCQWIAEQLDEGEPRAEGSKHGGVGGWWRESERRAEEERGQPPKAGPRGCKRLYLNDNEITGVGIRYIADALKRNRTLEELYLHYTDIGDDGLRELLLMLQAR